MPILVRRAATALCFLSFSICLIAQDTPQQKPADAPKPMSPTARLAAAKTAYVKRAAGADVAYDAIRYAIEGWGRFSVVGKPEDSDITIEVSAPGEGGGVSISSSSTGTNNTTGRPEQSSNTTHTFNSGGGPVKMTVYETKSKMLLFVASSRRSRH